MATPCTHRTPTTSPHRKADSTDSEAIFHCRPILNKTISPRDPFSHSPCASVDLFRPSSDSLLLPTNSFSPWTRHTFPSWQELVVQMTLTLMALFAIYSQTSSAPRWNPPLAHLLHRPIRRGFCPLILPFLHMPLPVPPACHPRLCRGPALLHDLLSNR